MTHPTTGSQSSSAAETEALGRDLAGSLAAGDILLLEGDLAAGKTTFVRGVVEGLGGSPESVSSPTFVLLQTYDCAAGDLEIVHHVDLYRLGEEVTDLREIGLDEVLSDRRAVVAVEWPKHTIAAWIPADARVWRVAISVNNDDSRTIEISGGMDDRTERQGNVERSNV